MGAADGASIERIELRRRVASVLGAAWREPGFSVPSPGVYAQQWLWDSCFHAIIWANLGSDRGLTELSNALANQADDGFVPHMTYWNRPDLHAEFWGRSGTSTITQPPMYGHALTELRRLGCPVPEELVGRARAGLLHLGRRPRTPAGLVPIFHPWESGCDDSARWDGHLGAPIGLELDADERHKIKGELVTALELGPAGHAIGSSAFTAGSIGFTSLVAWNAAELAAAFEHPDDALDRLAAELTSAVADRWRSDRWVDDPWSGPDDPAGARTADSLTALLIDPRPEGFEQLLAPQAFGAPYGPRGAHRAELTYRPDGYWRGSAWPQVTYLLMQAAERHGHSGTMRSVARWLVDGAVRSDLAEHWHPETGAALGAKPQSWAGLALPAARRR